MDGLDFDTATQRLSSLISRRRSLGVLAVLGAGLLTDEAAADKKRKRKRRRCQKKCPACQRCSKGKCKPARTNTPCHGGVCVNGVCPVRCETLADCRMDGSSNVCALNPETAMTFCNAAPGPTCEPGDPDQCVFNAECPTGHVCTPRICNPSPEGPDSVTRLCTRLVAVKTR